MLRWLRGFVLPSAACNVDKDEYLLYQILFEDLDRDGDGVLDIVEIREGLKNWSSFSPHAEKEILSAGDTNDDKRLDFEEFVKYLQEHEKKMKLAFKSLDKNSDGQIEASEIIAAFKSLGVNISKAQAREILQSITSDGAHTIDWDEWKYYFLLRSPRDVHDIVHFWKRTSLVDIGESLSIPDDFTEEERHSGDWWRRLVAGGIAGAVSRTCTAPLDRWKVMIQFHSLQIRRMELLTEFKQMIKEGGILSLWRGNGVNVLKIAPETAIKFAAYEQYKKLLSFDRDKIGNAERFTAGSLAGVTAQTFVYPLEVLKTRLAIATTGQYAGIADCAWKILKNESVKVFFRGYIPNFLGIIPYAGVELAAFELLKNYWLDHYADDSVDPGITVLVTCGAFSHTCGQVVSFPLNLIRTQMQTHALEEKAPTMLELIKEIHNRDGKRGFFRGLTPNVLKVLPAVIISCAAFEKAKQYLEFA